MATLALDGTLLVITPLSGNTAPTLTPYSARGLTQTLNPITSISGSGEATGTLIRRSINGSLINLTYPQFRKYASDISCQDSSAPCLDNAWLGEVVSVDCVCELAYTTAGGSPARPEVTGSSRVDGAFTYYRPTLIMMVTKISNSLAEWQDKYSWSIGLQEV